MEMGRALRVLLPTCGQLMLYPMAESEGGGGTKLYSERGNSHRVISNFLGVNSHIQKKTPSR